MEQKPQNFQVRTQGCKVGAYVLGETRTSPGDYYFDSGRCSNKPAAKRAVSFLQRLENRKSSIKIVPYKGGDFDILILFQKPERAMSSSRHTPLRAVIRSR